MKQKDTHKFARRVLMLLAVLFSLAGARADELTVYDGTDKNNTIPAYIFWFDAYTRSQFVIPADDLADMDIGATIVALKFYADQAYPESGKTPAPVDVYLKKVDYTDMEDKREKEGMEGMEDYEPKGDCTIVYQGTLSTGEDNVMTITFTTPYTYLGGNLLIGIDNTEKGDYQNVSFYGLSVDNFPAISSSNGSSADNIEPVKRQFIPKTTIIYTPLPAQSLPYYEDFGEGIIDRIDLWTMWNCEEEPGIQENMGVDNSNCFGFQWSTNPPQYLISPKFDGASAMKVSFKYAIGNSDWKESFQVGYSTTSNNVKAFTWGDEITATNVNNTGWLQYENIFPTGTKYIAIKCTSNDKFYLYLDDFSFEAFNGVYNLAASEVTATRATLDWAGSQESYNLRYRQSSDPTPSVTANHAHPRYISEWTIVEDVTAPYELTGLEPETNYEWQVQGNLSDGTTEWSELSSFTTSVLSTIPVTISDAGYSTLYYGTLNLVVPEGVTASTYSYDGTKIKESKTYDAGDVIPAGTGVVLEANAGTYEFVETAEAGEADANNALRGSDEAAETTGGDVFYALSLKDGANIGFYWRAEGGAAFTNGAHKAYLALPRTPVKGFSFGLEDDATAIETIVNGQQTTEGAIYNVAGQRLNKTQKGVNIVNGKKILK